MLTATQAVLLKRGKLYVEPSATSSDEVLLKAIDVELASLGFVMSTRLRAQLERVSAEKLGDLATFMQETLAARLGGNVHHEPLFRAFPHDIPDDTADLWWTRVISHFFQAEGQPCLFCRRIGTTHVLRPCMHVVCDECFDGSNYSACPICNRHVDRSSPFFEPSTPLPAPKERVRFKLLDLGDSIEGDARALFESFCARAQAMSPNDVDDLRALCRDFGVRVLPWLPERIVVKENMAHVFGALFREAADPMALLDTASAHLRTATDVLRLLASISGADPSLQGAHVARRINDVGTPRRWWGKASDALVTTSAKHRPFIFVSPLIKRFTVPPLRRPLRRALLSLLDKMNADDLAADMLRHRSYWVWLGQFLHPHEHARRFPNVARAFQIVRGKAPDGTPAPAFFTFSARVEQAAIARDSSAMLRLLEARPGELARRFDHVLRVAGDDVVARTRVVAGFERNVGKISTPVLLTLRSLLPTRLARAPVRLFWPKGAAAKAPSQPDERAPLSSDVVAPAVRAAERELLRRFAEKPAWKTALVDRKLADIVVPFNERTAARSAVALPRGSRVDVPMTKTARLFLHWCEPEKRGQRTDIDLSVGFYDASWSYINVCSYYQLKAVHDGVTIATSAGDLTSAPFPDGASEFVDIDRVAARKSGVRYAVMVVNNYSGMAFSDLERGFAGLMLRDDTGGAHFDPRTVALKFDLQGENGVYMPLVFDLEKNVIHWLDSYSKGMPELNNVETSNNAVTKVCPELIAYFGTGARASMLDLALLHAAARCSRVLVRGPSSSIEAFDRKSDEDAAAFLARLRTAGAGSPGALSDVDGAPTFAALLHGDVDLPSGSTAYALFTERVTGSIAASDLLS